MLSRCNKESDFAYKNYGARGIKVEWKNFEEFENDMLESYLINLKKYGEKISLDRINNDGNYSKENCRWATVKEQSLNRRSNLKYKGKYATYESIKLGGTFRLISNRIHLHGWDIKRAFTTPALIRKKRK